MEILRTPAEVREWSADLHLSGCGVALVPTMGFLHEGHLSLIREGRSRASAVATSIFVNPTQFGPNEDLSRYPRDMVGDLAKCEAAGATAVFTPEPSAMYPTGFQTTVEVGQLSQGLCGARRPGHFAGVATVVAKLFAMFRPEVALFGEKDFQQLRVLQQLALDLDLGIDVVGMPTVREADGLAMSSRNKYLLGPDRERALALIRGLRAAESLVGKGERRASVLEGAVSDALRLAGAREDYVELHDPRTLRRMEQLEGRGRMLVAAFLGTTRLIDNLELGAT